MALVVHVSYFPLAHKATNQHSVSLKISNGLIRGGHFVLNLSDRDLARMGSFFGHKPFGRQFANRALHKFCVTHHPDLLVLGHADVITAKTIATIREDLPGMRVLQWSVDALFDGVNVQRLRQKLNVVDATLVSTAGDALAPLKRPGMRLGFLPNPVDFSIERMAAHRQHSLPYDLFFGCGNPARLRNVCGRDWSMDDLMTLLLSRLPRIRPVLGGLLGRPHIRAAALNTVLGSSALGLNISRRADNYLYSSDRLAQLVGNGVVALVERSTGYGDLFQEDEMGFFSTLDELVAKIEMFCANPEHRMMVAAAGRTKYHQLFNETRVAAYLFDVAFDRCDPSDYEWPTLIL